MEISGLSSPLKDYGQEENKYGNNAQIRML